MLKRSHSPIWKNYDFFTERSAKSHVNILFPHPIFKKTLYETGLDAVKEKNELSKGQTATSFSD